MRYPKPVDGEFFEDCATGSDPIKVLTEDSSIIIATEPYEGCKFSLDQAERVYAALGRAIEYLKARGRPAPVTREFIEAFAARDRAAAEQLGGPKADGPHISEIDWETKTVRIKP